MRSSIVLTLAPVLLVGCASGGKSWVREAAARPPSDVSQAERASVTPEALEAEEVPRVVPRRVITLGARADSIVDEASPPAPPAPASVVVQVNVAAPTWGYGFAPYGYVGYPGWGGGIERPDHPGKPDCGPDRPKPDPAQPPVPPGVAGDWSPPPSYGPAPISHTVPGNPWR